VPELIAKTALDERGPLTLGGATLAETDLGPITSISVFPGAAKPVAKALKALGLAMPEPNSSLASAEARIIWTSRDQAFLIGAEPPPGLEGHAALADQTSGWATLSVSGPATVDVLMRLVPMDLRMTSFPIGRTARVPLNHVNMILLRLGDYAFEIMVFRSMARTAWHEIEAAMTALAARSALKP
jgi:heterotetrameric sarcosine oxidase gamma subunit